MAFDIVRAGRFFDKPRTGEGEGIHPGDSVVGFPYLIGVNHQFAIRTDNFAGDAHAADIVLQIAPDFQFQVVKTGVDGFLT
ncbi:hypothetical protein D3C80_1725950 [compost metagenome]